MSVGSKAGRGPLEAPWINKKSGIPRSRKYGQDISRLIDYLFENCSWYDAYCIYCKYLVAGICDFKDNDTKCKYMIDYIGPDGEIIYEYPPKIK
jgi:hypothetical protein